MIRTCVEEGQWQTKTKDVKEVADIFQEDSWMQDMQLVGVRQDVGDRSKAFVVVTPQPATQEEELKPQNLNKDQTDQDMIFLVAGGLAVWTHASRLVVNHA